MTRRGVSMSEEREHDPPVEDAGTADEPEAAKEDAPGRIQSVEWTTSTYRSSRKATDVPRKAAKTKPQRTGNAARPSPDAGGDT
jgi:hypothetical protein